MTWLVDFLARFEALEVKIDESKFVRQERKRGCLSQGGAVNFFAPTPSHRMHLNLSLIFATILVFIHRVSASKKPSKLVEYFPRLSSETVSKADEILQARHRGALNVQKLRDALARQKHKSVATVFGKYEGKRHDLEKIVAALEYPTCTARTVDDLEKVASYLVKEPAAVVLSRIFMNIPWNDVLQRVKKAAPEFDTRVSDALGFLCVKSIMHRQFMLAKRLLTLGVLKKYQMYQKLIYGSTMRATSLDFGSALLYSEIVYSILSLDKKGHLTKEMFANLKARCDPSYTWSRDDFLKHPFIDEVFFKNVLSFSVNEGFWCSVRELMDVASPEEITMIRTKFTSKQRTELCKLALQSGPIADLEPAWGKVCSSVSVRKDRHAAWFEKHATPIHRVLISLDILPAALYQFISEYAASQEI